MKANSLHLTKSPAVVRCTKGNWK